MMKRNEIKLASRTLAGFLSAGLSMNDALARMRKVQPAHKMVWETAQQAVNEGRPLSGALCFVWPDVLVDTLRAGESSGQLDGILRGIHDAIEVENEVIASLKEALYPLFMLGAGVVVGLFYMTFVIPGIAESLPEHDSTVLALSLSMKETATAYGWQILGGILVAIIVLTQALRTQEFKEWALSTALSIPLVNVAITDLRFGLWARYAALAVKSGVGTLAALNSTRELLPGPMRETLGRIINDLESNRSLEQSVDISRLPDDDPRHLWLPYFISTAFSTATQTGRLDDALEQVSPELIWQGKTRLKRASSIGKTVALGFAALIIVSPLGIAYLQIVQNMGTV